MNAAERHYEVQRWLRFAGEDLTAAEHLLNQSAAIPRHACWLAQQAAEKALKAVLGFLQIDFPRRHDLDALRNLIPTGWPLTAKHSDLASLTEWAIEAHYPGDWPDAVEADAQRAVEQARDVYDSVRSDLMLHGF
jgi:HEPN domain-containing protein